MRHILAPALALAAFAAPATLSAQNADPAPRDVEAPMAEMAERMADPQFQREMSVMLGALSQILLDLPIAPLAEAAADMAGEEARDIDPDLTLRELSPEAENLDETIERDLPRVMQAMSGMAESLAAMAPALEDMARTMREKLPPAAERAE